MLWWRRKSRERDLARELQSHLDLEAEDRQADGEPAADARFAARRALGNPTLIREQVRDTWGWASLDRLSQDFRYAARVLRRSPAFTAVAALSLALGIGANTAIFSLLDAVVLRSLPVPQPDQLVELTYTFPGPEPGKWNASFGYPHYERFSGRAATLSGLFAVNTIGRVSLGFQGNTSLAQAGACTASLFPTLGLVPQAGRFFSPAEDLPDAAVIVLSDRYWRTRFGADASIIGSSVAVNQLSFTVIGIAPRGFSGISTGSGPDIWVPLHALERLRPEPRRWTAPFNSWLRLAGRLRPGVSIAQAQAELDVLHRGLLAEQLSASSDRGRQGLRDFVRESRLVLLPAAGGVSNGTRATYGFPLKLLLGVSGIVLLVACANVANLVLARAAHRRGELALRLALGAGRGRIVRQVLAESLLLASLGGVLALALAWLGGGLLAHMISPGEGAPAVEVRPDWRFFAFSSAVTLLTGLLFGLAAALRGAAIDPGRALQESRRLAGGSSRSLDRILVVGQVALSVVLVAGAGLFARTLHNLWTASLGYDRENILLFSVDARLAGYPDNRAAAVYRRILDSVAAIPSVRSAAASIVRPVDDHFYLVDVIDEIDGQVQPDRDRIRVAWNALSPGYFSTIGTPLIAGRDFTLHDDESSPKVAIVNESLARRAFPGISPLGHRLAGATVVGMVKDSYYNGPRDKPRPVLYRPLFQHGPQQGFRWGFLSFELRYQAGAGLLDEVRRAVASVDRAMPVFRALTLRDQTGQALLKERMLATLSVFFGALALLLACLGLYGLMAYAVSRRTAEIGIRIALGARRGHVLWLVLRETFALSLAGVALGLPLALWTSRFARGLLYGITATDPVAMGLAAASLVAVAALGGYLPARRAARVDPMDALRCE